MRPLLDGLDFDCIYGVEKAWVERLFLDDEVYRSIMEIKGVKAPRLDGFSITFFQNCWDII